MKTPHTTVADLIKFLQTQPQEMVVVYNCDGNHLILEMENLEQKALQAPDSHGWIFYDYKNKPTQTYLVLPGC